MKAGLINGSKEMRALFVILVIAMTVSSPSFAEEDSMSSMNQLHDGVCKDHQKPELCKRVVGILMKSVQQNDDIYMECLKNKPSKPEDAMYCQNAKDIRAKISTYN